MNNYPKTKTIQVALGLLIGSSLVPTQADYAAKVLSNNPVAYWRLNDKATAPAGDVANNLGSLGSALNGYYVGAASHPLPGALASGSDSAVGLDATAGTAVSIPYSADANPNGAFTAEGWFSPNADTTTAAPTCALSSGQFGAPRSGWLIYQVDTGWSFRMYNQNGTTASLNIVGGPTPVIGTWYHVAAVYDGTNAFVYVNGVQTATGVPTGYVPSAGGALFIGGRADSAYWWNGTADEVAVYGKALPASEIDAHYKNGIAASPSKPYNQLVLDSAPLVYYRLNEAAYTPPATLPVAKNLGSAGTAADGTYNPGMNAQADGPKPPTYSGFEADNTGGGFNGNAGFVGTTASLNDLAKFTVMGWLRRGTAHSGRGGYFGQNDLLEFGDADSGANIEAWINAYNTNIKIPYPFRDKEWGLITLVGDGTSAVLYTNGVVASTLTQTVESYGTSAYNFNIGGGGIFNTAGDYFLGNIDEVAVFDKALTAQQVQEIYFGANIAPIITQQPAAPARDLYEGNPVTLTVAATGTPALQYQWRKGGSDLTGKTSADLAFDNIKVLDAGAYDVVVQNNYGSVTSVVVNLTVKPADTVAPTLQYANSSRTLNTVRVWFSEGMDTATAETASNYQLSGGVTVTSAKLSAPAGSVGDNIVDLVTSAQTPGQVYTLTVNGVKDQAAPANTIAANSTVEFSAWVLMSGTLDFEHYDSISGAADSDITKGLADPRVVAGKPTTKGFITGRLDTRTVFPDDSHENYLARITGFITPTESGDYNFFLGSDDASRLYLSKTESIPNPSTDTMIANEPACCRAFQEPGDSATSEPIALQAGKRYGVLILLKEGGGGDWLKLAWRKSTDGTAAADLPALPGQFFATYVDPNADLKFVKQPTDQVGSLPSPVVEFVSKDFTTSDGGFTVVNTDPAPPGPFNYAGGVWTADGGEDACSGPYNSQLVSPELVVPQTEEVAVTFTHRYSFEGDSWDGGQLRISVNGGEFTPVPAEKYTANGYAVKPIQGNGVLLNQRAFNGDSTGYAAGEFITSSAILGAFKQNDKIVLAFVGAWDDCSSASKPGWVIKTVKLAYGKAPKAVTFEAEGSATRQGQAAPFTYQWQRNDGTGFVNIADATAASYVFYPVAADFSATFQVVISVPGKALNSNVVKLLKEGEAKPTIAIQAAAGNLTITYTGALQSSATVNGTYTDVAGATSPYQVANPTGTLFFRAVNR
jgi:hypothetical protein